MIQLFDYFFPSQVLAFVTDRSIDFKLTEDFSDFSEKQKVFLATHLPKTPKVVTIRQVHGDDILEINEQTSAAKISEADGFITASSNVPLTVRTADCLSVFIFDPHTPAIGLFHAGWRGTQKKIAAKVVTMMKKRWNSRAADLNIVFGPSIRECCYEVGEDFKQYFPTEVKQKKTGLYLDLPLANIRQFLDVGVKKENIRDLNVCTYCNERFFSFRRQGEKAGRMLSLMMLRK